MQFIAIIKKVLIGIILTLGVLALTVRLGTAYINTFKDDLAVLLSDKLEGPVSIDALEARWRVITPSLKLYGFTLGEGEQTLELQSAELDVFIPDLFKLSFIDSLRLSVKGLHLHLVRENDGQIRLLGIGHKAKGQGMGDASDDQTAPVVALPNHMRFSNTRLIWEDRQFNAPPLVIDNVSFQADRLGEDIKISGHLDGYEGQAVFAAKLTGHIRRSDWFGESYLKVTGVNLADIIGPHLPQGSSLDSAYIDIESWGQWKEAQLTEVQGQLNIENVRFSDESLSAWAIDSARTYFHLQQTTQSWLGKLHQFSLDLPHNSWPTGDIDLRHTKLGDKSKTQISLEYIDIADISNAALPLTKDQDLQNQLQQIKPQGVLRNSRITLIPSDNNWRFSTQLERLSLNAYNSIPGIKGFSSHLEATPDFVRVLIDSQDFEFNSPTLFRKPIPGKSLKGELNWDKLENGWQLYADNLALQTVDIETTTRLWLTELDNKPGFLDLQTDFANGDLSNISLYLPSGVMGDELVAWLDNGIRKGTARSGSALFHGPYDDFAFSKTFNGNFEVLIHGESVDLHYHEQLPPLLNANARVLFHRNSLDIEGQSGKVLNSDLNSSVVNIESLDPISPLMLKGEVAGPITDVTTLLSQPPLDKKAGAVVNLLKAEGESRLRLDALIPLDSSRHPEMAVDAFLTLKDNKVELPEWQISFDKVNGELTLVDDKLKAKGIRSRFHGRPVTLSVGPGGKHSTVIKAKGMIDKKNLAKRFPELPLDAISGSTPAQFAIEIGHKGTPSAKAIKVNSQLSGLRIDAPKPFGKEANSKKPFSLEIPLQGKNPVSKLNYNNLVRAAFSSDWSSADIALGKKQKTLAPPKTGFRVHGILHDLKLDEWSEQLSGSSDNPPKNPITLALKLSGAKWEDKTLSDTDVSLNNTNDAWQGKISNKMLSGNYRIPFDSNQPISIDLDHLSLKFNTKERTKPQDKNIPDPAAGPNPSALPSLALSCKNLTLNQAKLGQLNLETERNALGHSITRLSLTGDLGEFDGRGYWLADNQGYKTTLLGGGKLHDLGELLDRLGYGKPMQNAKTEFEINAEWPGNPSQLHAKTLALDSSIKLSNGQLLDVEPGVARLTGLISLTALTRRLQLDFSDVFDKGLSFDEISGNIDIHDGNAYTHDLKLRGPSTRIDFDGRLGLLDEDIDQHLIIHPNLDGTLPLAGTLISGPAAGVAILVAQQIAPKQIDKLNRFEYSVRGPWHQPEIKQLDTGGLLSKLLKPFTSGDNKPTQESAKDESTPKNLNPIGD